MTLPFKLSPSGAKRLSSLLSQAADEAEESDGDVAGVAVWPDYKAVELVSMDDIKTEEND